VFFEVDSLFFLAHAILDVQTCEQVASVDAGGEVEDLEDDSPSKSHLCVGCRHGENHLSHLQQQQYQQQDDHQSAKFIYITPS
jgi:hypothetical protein